MDDAVERLYGVAKDGKWDDVLAAMAADRRLAARCARWAKPTSGWTFLHQAAYWGHGMAARALVGLGASLTHETATEPRQTPADVATERGHAALSRALRTARATASGLWDPVADPDVLPSSSAYLDAERRRALLPMRVGYGGAVITIPAGARYYVDAYERVLVGWHGTYDPPRGMDAEVLVDGASD